MNEVAASGLAEVAVIVGPSNGVVVVLMVSTVLRFFVVLAWMKDGVAGFGPGPAGGRNQSSVVVVVVRSFGFVRMLSWRKIPFDSLGGCPVGIVLGDVFCRLVVAGVVVRVGVGVVAFFRHLEEKSTYTFRKA